MPTQEPNYRYTEAPSILEHVPVPLRVAGAWSWRLVVVGVVAVALTTVVATLAPIIVPVSIAVLIAAPMERMATWLGSKGIPRTLASLSLVLGLIGLVAGLLAAAGQSVASGLGELKDKALAGIDTLVDWLVTGPLQVSEAELRDYLDRAGETLQDNSAGLVSGAVSVTATVGLVSAGALIALFCLFFFLRDGRAMWLWLVGLLPEEARERTDFAGRAGWATLGAYSRTSVFVAFVDAVGIGLGAWILGLPLALPIAIVVFLGSFVPIVGATVTGAVAVLVALVDGGWATALIMLGIVILVQQLEGSILYPWLFGKAADVHPVAILLTVAAGAIVAGMVGALLAVPLLALTKSFITGLRRSGVGPTTAIPIQRGPKAAD